MTYDGRITWRELIGWEMESHGESFSDVVACSLTEEELDVRFDNDFGGVEGKPFFLWTKERVYFAAEYDGAEGCESVPRNPCDETPEHL